MLCKEQNLYAVALLSLGYGVTVSYRSLNSNVNEFTKFII